MAGVGIGTNGIGFPEGGSGGGVAGVTSINGQTGVVNLTASDVGAEKARADGVIGQSDDPTTKPNGDYYVTEKFIGAPENLSNYVGVITVNTDFDSANGGLVEYHVNGDIYSKYKFASGWEQVWHKVDGDTSIPSVPGANGDYVLRKTDSGYTWAVSSGGASDGITQQQADLRYYQKSQALSIGSDRVSMNNPISATEQSQLPGALARLDHVDENYVKKAGSVTHELQYDSQSATWKIGEDVVRVGPPSYPPAAVNDFIELGSDEHNLRLKFSYAAILEKADGSSIRLDDMVARKDADFAPVPFNTPGDYILRVANGKGTYVPMPST